MNRATGRVINKGRNTQYNFPNFKYKNFQRSHFRWTKHAGYLFLAILLGPNEGVPKLQLQRTRSLSIQSRSSTHPLPIPASDISQKQGEGDDQRPEHVDMHPAPDPQGVGEFTEFSQFFGKHAFIGGQLKLFYDQWKTFTSDIQVLQYVTGHKLEFIEDPPLQMNPPYQFNLAPSESEAVDLEISRLLEKNVIILSEHEYGEYISSIFTRPKKDGGHRMILNLSKLNDYIEYHHFKMDTLDMALKLVSPNSYMASIDMSDAYYSVAIDQHDQKYLKFIWKGKLYQFVALPNGLCSGPRLFTKLLKPPFSYLRRLGHIITGYIDDTLLIGSNINETKSAVFDTLDVLTSLGFTIHPIKSVLQPTQEIKYLGFIVNSKSMTIKLTEEKCAEVISLCKNLISKDHATIKIVSSVIGKIVATFPGVRFGPLHYRELEKEKSNALKINKGNYSAHMTLSIRAKSELTWWITNLGSAFAPITLSKPDITLQTDASGLGWGATDGSTKTGGRWNELELFRADYNDINHLELWASFLALRAFCHLSRNIHVLIKSDNKTAIAYMNHMGGTKSHVCNELSKEIWQWCCERNIWITATYLEGSLNCIADYCSRNFNDQTEWQLNPSVFQKLSKFFGKPCIDLFASRLNAQLSRFVSWLPDPDAEAIDAFTLVWTDMFFYAFPPFLHHSSLFAENYCRRVMWFDCCTLLANTTMVCQITTHAYCTTSSSTPVKNVIG